MTTNLTPVVIVPPKRSVAAAVLLTVLFGPLGSLYAGAAYGLVWLLVSVGAAMFTLGLSLLITWPAVVIWTAIKVSNDNTRANQLLRQ